ncbi:MAG: prepilin peptidase [Hyphomicrobiales bacterium]|nr:prepilin peptidase [Hyphomicrobiales bacterium]MDE2017576.1 prepilin peptidase [Hyphomicrobiales bacterium]
MRFNARVRAKRPNIRVTDARTPLVGAIATIATISAFGFLPPVPAFECVALGAFAAAVTVFDVSRFRIPDALNAAGVLAGVAAATAHVPGSSAASAAMFAVARASCAALTALVVRVGYRKARGREGLGLGDVKLAAVAGAWLDPFSALMAVEVAAVSAIFVALACARFRPARLSPSMKIPFGAYFAPAIWLTWVAARWA